MRAQRIPAPFRAGASRAEARSRGKDSSGAWALGNPYALAIYGHAPLMSSATVDDEYLTFTMDRDFTGCPVGPGWVVTYRDGSTEGSAYAECSGRSVKVWLNTAYQGLALASQFNYVSLAYNKEAAHFYGGSRLVVNGIEVGDFSGVPVTNRWPLLAAAAVNGNVMTLTYEPGPGREFGSVRRRLLHPCPARGRRGNSRVQKLPAAGD